MMYATVGRLKKILSEYDDDAVVVVTEDDNVLYSLKDYQPVKGVSSFESDVVVLRTTMESISGALLGAGWRPGPRT